MAKDEGQKQLRSLSKKIWWHKQYVNCYCDQAWGAQKYIEITQKNTAAASTLPGMIAPSVFSCFASLFLSLNPAPPPHPHMHGCLPDVRRGISGFNDITNVFLSAQQWPNFDWCRTVRALSWCKESCLLSSIESSILAGDEACLPYLIICLVGKPLRLIR